MPEILLSLLPFCFPSHFPCPCSCCSSCNPCRVYAGAAASSPATWTTRTWTDSDRLDDGTRTHGIIPHGICEQTPIKRPFRGEWIHREKLWVRRRNWLQVNGCWWGHRFSRKPLTARSRNRSQYERTSELVLGKSSSPVSNVPTWRETAGRLSVYRNTASGYCALLNA
jgi:hypothetical protein